MMPKEEAFDMLMEGINEFAEDCMAEGRDQGHQQERKSILPIYRAGIGS